MKKYRLSFSWKRFKVIPRKYTVFLLMLCVISTFCFLGACILQYERIEDTQRITGTIADVKYTDTYASRGSRILLSFEVNGQDYGIWYPNDGSRQYIKLLEKYSQNDNLTVDLLISKGWYYWGDNHVVDLRNEDDIFYDIDIENASIHQQKVAGFVAGMLISVVLLFVAIAILLSYGVIKIARKY